MQIRNLPVILSVLFAIASIGSAQSGSESGPKALPIVPNAGNSWLVEISRTRGRIENSNVSKTQGQIAARMQFSSATEDGYQVVWQTLSVTAGDLTVTGDQFGKSMLIGVPFEVRASSDGSPISLNNWDAIRNKLITVFEELGKAKPTNPKANRKFLAMLEGWTQESAAQLLLTELGILAICQGTNLIVGEKVESSTSVSSPIGGPPIDVKTTYELVSIDHNNGRAYIEYSHYLVPESFIESSRIAAKEIARSTGRDVDEIMSEWENAEFENRTTAKCSVDLATGMTVEVEFETNATVNPTTAIFDGRKIRVSSTTLAD